jgi:predicted dehydrogenase
MFSEHVQAKYSLSRVALFGGGRWSRVLLPVLQSLLGADSEIVWVTEHGYEPARRWLIGKGIDRVSVSTHSAMDASSIEAAVVATSPARHGQQVRQLLERGIPTLCEKPFTLDFDEATALERMAASAACPLGVNLEMHFASFVEDFATLLGSRISDESDLRKIELTWLDPWSESRYGETKHGDVYTSIADDMWPHCWSLLRRLCPRGTVSSVKSVSYDPSSGQVEVVLKFASVTVRVLLSRRSDRRVRRVDVNGGEAVLDFSTEPGITEIDGAVSMNAWRGERPLSRSLNSFFEVACDTNRTGDWAADWALSVSACLDSVRSAQQIGDELRRLQRTTLEDLRDSGIELEDERQRNLIVDLLLPEYADNGRRWPAITLEEQVAFIKHVCETRGMRCK